MTENGLMLMVTCIFWKRLNSLDENGLNFDDMIRRLPAKSAAHIQEAERRCRELFTDEIKGRRANKTLQSSTVLSLRRVAQLRRLAYFLTIRY
jgi:hypothetical protein